MNHWVPSSLLSSFFLSILFTAILSLFYQSLFSYRKLTFCKLTFPKIRQIRIRSQYRSMCDMTIYSVIQHHDLFRNVMVHHCTIKYRSFIFIASRAETMFSFVQCFQVFITSGKLMYSCRGRLDLGLALFCFF